MTNCFVHPGKWNPILVIVCTIFYQTADGNQIFGQFKVSRIAGGTVHFNHPHIMRRTNGIAGQFGRCPFVKVAKKIGRFDGYL